MDGQVVICPGGLVPGGPDRTQRGKGLAMSKRLNPHRRLLARQAAALEAARVEQSSVHGEEMSKLQQGLVRSALAPRVQLTAYSVPRERPWEGRGKLVRKQSKPRFGTK